MKSITVLNRTRGTLVASRVQVADTFVTRLVGLLGRDRLDEDGGLLIQPSSGVHTFGMRFSIDVAAIDRRGRVRALWHNLPPWRMSGISWRYHSMLELPAGQLQRCSVQVTDQLEFVALPPDLR
ncbi:MAG: DUF192 domain-containing protein [Acidobacteriaceae bacterium]